MVNVDKWRKADIAELIRLDGHLLITGDESRVELQQAAMYLIRGHRCHRARSDDTMDAAELADYIGFMKRYTAVFRGSAVTLKRGQRNV